MTQSKSCVEVWDSISLDLVSVQIEGEIVYINTAGAKMLGATIPGQLIGKPILDFVHPDYRQIEVERVRQLKTAGLAVCPIKERWRRLDGTVFDVEVAALSICYEGKLAVQLIAQEANRRMPYRPARNWHLAPWSRSRGQR